MANSNLRSRNYFITINQNAKCFKDVLCNQDDFINSKFNYSNYAMILHNKDMTEDNNYKNPHIHIIIELVNAVSFQSIQKKLPGAHVEVANNVKRCYAYLLHETPGSSEKYNYSINEIITNNKDYVNNIIDQINDKEVFNEDLCIIYIAKGINSYYRFFKTFGLQACVRFWNAYEKLLNQINTDSELSNEIELIRAEIFGNKK